MEKNRKNIVSNISKDLVGNVFGKDIHSPIDRANVRELVAFKEQFINDLMAKRNLIKTGSIRC